MRATFDVSICVPTYQGADYLDECLASIEVQDLDGVEVLVIDDASTDATVEIANSYAGRIPHLSVRRNDARRGAVANFNGCIEAARGAWIKPVFQDDLLEPGCLAAMRAARRRRVPVVVCARNYRYEAGVPDWRRAACDHLLDQALDHRFGGGVVDADQVAEVAVELAAQRVPQLNFVGEPVSLLLDRKAVLRSGGFDEGYVQLWDYELVLRLAMRRGIVVVGDRLATFRVHEASETARNLSGSTFAINVVDRLRLHTAYATSGDYRRARKVASRHDPPIHLTALAVGVGRAADELLQDLPPQDQPPATAAVLELVERLPPSMVGPAEWTASEASDALLWELSPERMTERARTHEDSGDDQAEEVEMPTDVGAASRRTLKVARVARGLRTSEWWSHMLGPIVAFACLQLGWRHVAPGAGMVRVVALLVSAIALAGYGYVVNDTCDVAPDRLAGKPNAMARLPPAARLAVIAGFAGIGLLPWIWIHLERSGVIALGGIYLLPLLYSAPPVRLKERHVLGPIADAANAFILPASFTIALFAPLGPTTGPAPLMVAGAALWTSGFGLRAILLHQIIDAANDRISGTRTLVVMVGEERARTVLRSVLFPVEVAGLVLLAITVATWSWGAVAIGLGVAAAFNGARLLGVIDRGLATTTLDRGWFLYWYQIWPALLLSVALVVTDVWYLLLVALVLVLFWPRVRSAVGILYRETVRELRQRRNAPHQGRAGPERLTRWAERRSRRD